MNKIKSPSTQLNSLANEIGFFIEYWGFKKIHGMIWTHLYLSNKPLSALDLIPKLKVSKALISISIKDLIKYNLIIQTEDSENKKNKFYYSNPDIFGAIKNVLDNREIKMMEKIKNEFKKLKEIKISKTETTKDIINAEKLEKLEEMISGANSVLMGIASAGEIDSKMIQMMFSVN